MIVQRLSGLYGRQAVHMPSMLRYELDIDVPKKFFTHIPDELVLMAPQNASGGTKMSPNGTAADGMIRTRLHLYPSLPATGNYEDVIMEYLDCRKVTCCGTDKFELLWLLPGAGFDVRVSVEARRVCDLHSLCDFDLKKQ